MGRTGASDGSAARLVTSYTDFEDSREAGAAVRAGELDDAVAVKGCLRVTNRDGRVSDRRHAERVADRRSSQAALRHGEAGRVLGPTRGGRTSSAARRGRGRAEEQQAEAARRTSSCNRITTERGNSGANAEFDDSRLHNRSCEVPSARSAVAILAQSGSGGGHSRRIGTTSVGTARTRWAMIRLQPRARDVACTDATRRHEARNNSARLLRLMIVSMGRSTRSRHVPLIITANFTIDRSLSFWEGHAL